MSLLLKLCFSVVFDFLPSAILSPFPRPHSFLHHTTPHHTTPHHTTRRRMHTLSKTHPRTTPRNALRAMPPPAEGSSKKQLIYSIDHVVVSDTSIATFKPQSPRNCKEVAKGCSFIQWAWEPPVLDSGQTVTECEMWYTGSVRHEPSMQPPLPHDLSAGEHVVSRLQYSLFEHPGLVELGRYVSE